MLKQLSKNDCIKLLDYIELTSSVNLDGDVLSHLFKLSDLFNFEKVVCTYSPLSDYLSPEMKYDYFATNLSDDYMITYVENDFHLTDPVVTEYFSTFDLIHWRTLTDSLYADKNDAIDLSEQVGLFDGFTYGVFSKKNDKHTVFLWGGKSIENNDRTNSIIKYTTPFLSELIKKKENKGKRDELNLTPKELEVLNWLKEGKSSWETGMILRISERTVNFHINNIKTKLNASNRTHCVAIAISNGLIQLN